MRDGIFNDGGCQVDIDIAPPPILTPCCCLDYGHFHTAASHCDINTPKMMCLPLQDTSGQVKGQALRLGAVHKGRGMLLGNAWQLTVSATEKPGGNCRRAPLTWVN